MLYLIYAMVYHLNINLIQLSTVFINKHGLFYLHIAAVMDITSFRQSFVIDLKDRITPMMVILFSTFSPPESANERN